MVFIGYLTSYMQTFQYFQKYQLSKLNCYYNHGLSEYLILIGWQVGIKTV